MASDHVLRIPRTDSPGEYVLLNTSSCGSSPLDLKLLATEGTEPYVKTLKHSRIPKYRAKTNHLSDQKWEEVLRSTLLQERPQKALTTPENQDDDEKPEDASPQTIQLVAYISSSKLTITFRNSISGIHQKLGELSLAADPDTNINLFDWTSTAIARAETAQAEADDLQRRLATQTETMKQLHQQLEELIQAKKDHEDTLLQKFCILLNEKKAKIRDQQRILATAKPDPVMLKEVQKARQLHAAAAGRDPEPSRKGKRKASGSAAAAAASDEDNDDDHDGFEDRGVKVENEGPDSEAVTPEHSDLDATEDEEEEAEADNKDLAPVPAKGKVMEAAGINGGGEAVEDMELPPRRELPFNKDDLREKTPADHTGKDHQDIAMADDDETDDDEL
ncbi:MAG: hypothetical protein LQ341_004560 [Variospora aurantia]|nr:MAG: hypothetical protein LQ341_004560 [Variospora aurantia]